MKKSLSYKVFLVINAVLLILLAISCLYPFLNMFATSLSTNEAVMKGSVSIWPEGFNLEAYRRILKESQFWIGYKNTILYTVVGTIISLVMTIICAYPLSRKNLIGKKPILLFMIFTMYFGGGLIPSYLLIKNLGMMNTIASIVLPGAISVYNMLIMKTFFQGIPESLIEAAQIDGMGHLGILCKIIVPLSKPILATMTLFYAVGYWNDWFTALIYMNSNSKYPVTLFLRDIVMGVTLQAQSGQAIDASAATSVMAQTMQSATVMLVTVPILCVYPFVQKHFVKGVMIGSVKE
ncbi:carbohydrate ABC transporter permease [Clostridioides difficile]